jgi:hypothetical protein
MDTTSNPVTPAYLKRSAKVFKIYTTLFLFSIFMSVFIRPLLKNYSDLLDVFVGLPVFIALAMPPIGLYYSWKSYRRKEGQPKILLRYFVGHMFFCLLVLIIIRIFISDISKWF